MWCLLHGEANLSLKDAGTRAEHPPPTMKQVCNINSKGRGRMRGSVYMDQVHGVARGRRPSCLAQRD